ncbi:MAG: hypothetical protein QOF82_957, partial [Frankiales bacterium]|nr:hypothetical protein [Frankiales bacterium]
MAQWAAAQRVAGVPLCGATPPKDGPKRVPGHHRGSTLSAGLPADETAEEWASTGTNRPRSPLAPARDQPGQARSRRQHDSGQSHCHRKGGRQFSFLSTAGVCVHSGRSPVVVRRPAAEARSMRLLLDLLLPCSCVACPSERGPVCPDCGSQRWEPRRRDPTPRPTGLPPVWAAAEFGGPMRDLVLAYKQDGCWPALRPLTTALTDTVLAATRGRAGPILLVPVPSSAAARRRRGHHHVLALCRRAGRGGDLRAAGVSVA